MVVDPGPNLNIIIGPNGTGKSTIVAAIILGLGGTVKTIGRGTKVAEYVRNGCTEARIDIELNKESTSQTYIISRQFNINNQNNWYINNKHTTEAAVKDLTKTLNIQVNNLCQFLPQDRVQDFAKMNKKELLKNMQLAVGRQDLVDKQEKLVEIQIEQETLKKELDALNTRLEQAQRDSERLESKVKNYNERKGYIEELEHVKRKLSWETCHKLKNKADEIKSDLKKFKVSVDKHKAEILPIENQIKLFNNKNNDIQRKLFDSVSKKFF